MPSYVDDVLEYTNLAAFPTTGEAGKIYVALDTNKTYRWSGTVYVYITSGAVDSVAGKTGVVTLVKGDVGLGNVDNTSDSNKPVSTAQQIALNLKANLASPTFNGTPAAPTAPAGTNTTQIANTTFVTTAVKGKADTVHTHDVATTSVAGFMSAADKTKLDGIAAGANVNTASSTNVPNIGSIAFVARTIAAYASSPTINYGDTVAGSTLKVASIYGGNATQACTGTWKVLSFFASVPSGSNAVTQYGLAMRIA